MGASRIRKLQLRRLLDRRLRLSPITLRAAKALGGNWRVDWREEMASGVESEGKKRRINADEDEEMPEASAAAAPRPLPAPPSAAHEQFSPELLRL